MAETNTPASTLRSRPAALKAEKVVPDESKRVGSATLTREQRQSDIRKHHALFLLKIVAFLMAFGGFTWYFWPWANSNPIEFQHSHIRNLNSTEFEPHVLREDETFRIIKFYANWCDHCKAMAPIWSEAALQHGSDSSLEFLQVECSKNNKLCRKAGVEGFPHFKIFYNGRIGYSQIGALNSTQMEELVTGGIQSARDAHIKYLAVEKEKRKDAEESAKDSKTQL